MKKSCTTCIWLDEYFGDCCHPKSGGAKDIHPAIKGCARNSYKWLEPKKETKPR